ncbi:MAG TPA: YbhB/YbcL family Raf kinase inhibitor-like protein [Candidatus Mcinerneyibacterium sp.]|nr:YbhB/YbcL family Raf kinase inhibitor-like protein [Candidatus Mcinerneyibacterium sp.]
MGKIVLKSSVFKNGQFIPQKYTCDGEDISPQLKWSNFPKETKSFVLICDDPDAPMGTWDHWILFNIPANITSLEKNFDIKNNNIDKLKAGRNDFGKKNYGGPCPPDGTHRYFFRIFALNKFIDLEEGVSKKEVLNAIDGHVLDDGELMGKYNR